MSAAALYARALGAGLATPWWLGSGRWRALLEPAGATARGASSAPTVLTRAADRVVRVLSWLPLSPWRSTCLYRSVAVCLALRRSGVAARLRLGASSAERVDGPPRAHAWVEDEQGRPLYGRPDGWTPLTAERG